MYANRQEDGSWIIGCHNGLLSCLLTLLALQFGAMKATSVRCGNYVGALDARRAKLVAKLAMLVSCFVSSLSTILLLAARNEVGRVFSKDPRVINEAADIIFLVGAGLPVLALFYVAMSVLDAAALPGVVAVAFFFGSWVVCLPVALELGLVLDLGLMGIWTGLILGYGTTTLILCFKVYHLDWAAILEAARVRNTLGGDAETGSIRSTLRRMSITSNLSQQFPSPIVFSS